MPRSPQAQAIVPRDATLGMSSKSTILFPQIDTSLHHRTNPEYADKAFSMSLDVQQKNIDSHHMRVTNSIVLQVVDRNDSLYLGKVNRGFRVKMAQTHELKAKLEKAIRDNSCQAALLERSRGDLLKVKAKMVEPKSLCKKRQLVRENRPASENVEDSVHTALKQEEAALNAIIEQLDRKTEALSDMLERNTVIREKLVNDLKDKRHALNCDNNCLTMRPERAARHPPPHRETLHTAVTTMAGEVTPASPTAILNGESATGRFSYEWIFSKADREALKLAFSDVASEGGEIMAGDFERVYTDAGVAVNLAQNPSVAQMMSLHPDTQLTWSKFCELLASMRQPASSEPVMLPHQWRHRTEKLLENNDAVNMTSKMLLAQAQEVTRTVDDVKREAHLVVQKCLRRKIQETMDLRSLAEKRITETDLEIRRVEHSEVALKQSFERKARPLAVSEARYNIRRMRREGEEVHDEVEDLIAQEVEELQKGVAAIQAELEQTRTILVDLRENRKMLEEDILNKNITLEMEQRCLKMASAAVPRSSFNSFLRGHV